ncbi:MAG TPA: DUF2845 domain-containing protein [Polyangiales bacterium]
MRTRLVSGLMVSGLMAWSASTYADGMRCGTKLVSDGDSMYEVRNACGNPDQAVQRTELRTVSRWVDGPCIYPGQVRCGSYVQTTIEVQVDEWLYDFGTHEFIRNLVFESGRLIRVTTGSYGRKQT